MILAQNAQTEKILLKTLDFCDHRCYIIDTEKSKSKRGIIKDRMRGVVPMNSEAIAVTARVGAAACMI